MSIQCKFVLSRNSNIYYSGEEIKGLLTICCLKKCQLEAIFLEFYGFSSVQWWELLKSEENILHSDISSHEISDKTFYQQQYKHVFQQFKLDLPNHKEFQPHVEYTFKFVVQIPQNAPATFNCFYGRTQYDLRVQVKRVKKINKEFCKRIVIKNRLDLTKSNTYRETCAVYCLNNFAQIALQIPCSGFTPGQNIPFHLKYLTNQINCKLLLELNRYITCRIYNNSNKFKQLKQNINKQKHLSTDISSFMNIPLHCLTTSRNDPEWLIKTEYLLEALLIKNNKKVLLRTSIPLTIGTTPCYAADGDLESFMCFKNWGSDDID